MGQPGEGQLVDVVQLSGAKGEGRRVLDDHRLGMGLDHRPASMGVLLIVVRGKGPCILLFVLLDLRKAGDDHRILPPGLPPAAHLLFDCGPGDIPDLIDLFPGIQPPGHLQDGLLPHAIDQEVGGSVCQDGLADGVGPVVVVSKAAQAGLDSSQDDWNIGKEGVHPVGIDDARPVRAEQAAARGVDVPAAAFEVGGEVVDHGVHIARGDAEEETGRAQPQKVLIPFRIRLGNDSHGVAGIPEHPAQKARPEGGVIDIGISAHQDDVELLDGEVFGLLHRYGQEEGLLGHDYL